MDFFSDPCNVMTFTSWLLALLMDANDCLVLPEPTEWANEGDVVVAMHLECVDALVLDTFSFMSNTLYNYRLYCKLFPLTDELDFWIKPRSIWFVRP